MSSFGCIASDAKYCVLVILSAISTVLSHDLFRLGLTQAHDNAVIESLGMQHKSFGLYQEVSQHLHGLRILKRYMFPLTPRFVELLMYELSKQSPLCPTVHH